MRHFYKLVILVGSVSVSVFLGMLAGPKPAPVAVRDPSAWLHRGDEVTLVVVAGQSNATSRAPDGDLAIGVPVENVFQVARLTDLRIIPAYEPLQHWDMTPNGVGFGFEFAKLYAREHPDLPVILVPAAKGETGLVPDEWQAGGYLGLDLAKRVNSVASRFAVTHCFFLWHQGETEVVAGSKSYKADVQAAFAAMKKDAPALDVCIFLVGGLSDEFIDAHKATATAVVADLMAIPGTRFVSAAGLQTMDGVNFTAASQLELGARYFAALSE